MEIVGHFSSRSTKQYWYSHRGCKFELSLIALREYQCIILGKFLHFPLYPDLNNIIYVKMGIKTHLYIFHLKLLTDLYSKLGLHLPLHNILAVSRSSSCWVTKRKFEDALSFHSVRIELFVQSHLSQIFTMNILKTKRFRRSLSDSIPCISF